MTKDIEKRFVILYNLNYRELSKCGLKLMLVWKATMVKVLNPGHPCLGENREWKELIEFYWVGDISQEELQARAEDLCLEFLKKQVDTGLNFIPVDDFLFHGHILDLSI